MIKLLQILVNAIWAKWHPVKSSHIPAWTIHGSTPFLNEQDKEIIAMYADDVDITVIAKEFNRSPNSIRARLASAGLYNGRTITTGTKKKANKVVY